MATVVAAIATVEAIIMYWLPVILPPNASPHLEALVDSFALSILVFPLLWIVLIGPLRMAADQSYQRYRTLVEHLTDAVLITDTSGRILAANHAADSLFGYSDGLNGRGTATLLDMETRAAGTHLDGPREVWALTGAGERVPIELSLSEARSNGTIERVYVIRDITPRRHAEAELMRAQQALLETSRLAGMSEIASGVLHNIGNVLNSVNISVDLVAETLDDTHIRRLEQVSALLATAAGDASRLPKDRFAQLEEFLAALTDAMQAERSRTGDELRSLRSHVDHIKQIVQCQGAFTAGGRIEQDCRLVDLIEDAISINEASLQRHGVEVTRNYDCNPTLATDRHKVIQILVNLISNAKSAVTAAEKSAPSILVSITQTDTSILIKVSDNGEGIASENLLRIFQHGFTTRKDGHGFGLHSSAIAAQELGGALTASSEGPGYGATFRLELPVVVRASGEQEPAPC